MSHPLLTAPIGRSLLRLAGPTTAIMMVQILVTVGETAIIGRMGTEALAGFALVFPFIVLTFNMATGSLGGAVASALARALGAGRRDDANAIVLHALLLAAGFGLLFAAAAWLFAPTVFTWLGGTGDVRREALLFAHIWFTGAPLLWIGAFLGAMLRGSGDTATPARYGLVTAITYILLAGFLGLGAGSWPGLGIAGPAIASLTSSSMTLLLLTRAVRRGRLGFTPKLAGMRLQPRLFRDILGVGLVSSISTIVGIVTASVVTAFVARFGPAALAGYGIAVRLEYMLGPIAFGIGSGLTTLVGVAAGAGDWQRAVRAAWTGSLIAAVAIGVAGGIVALLAQDWSALFTTDPEAIAVSVACITRVGPVFALFGLGLTLYFASQGTGRMNVPLVASLLRSATTVLGAWLAVDTLDLGLDGVFVAIAIGIAVHGGVIGGTLLISPWRGRLRRR